MQGDWERRILTLVVSSVAGTVVTVGVQVFGGKPSALLFSLFPITSLASIEGFTYLSRRRLLESPEVEPIRSAFKAVLAEAPIPVELPPSEVQKIQEAFASSWDFIPVEGVEVPPEQALPRSEVETEEGGASFPFPAASVPASGTSSTSTSTGEDPEAFDFTEVW